MPSELKKPAALREFSPELAEGERLGQRGTGKLRQFVGAGTLAKPFQPFPGHVGELWPTFDIHQLKLQEFASLAEALQVFKQWLGQVAWPSNDDSRGSRTGQFGGHAHAECDVAEACGQGIGTVNQASAGNQVPLGVQREGGSELQVGH